MFRLRNYSSTANSHQQPKQVNAHNFVLLVQRTKSEEVRSLNTNKESDILNTDTRQMVTKTILHFQYKPIDFFEVPFQYSDPKYTMTLENGVAEIILSEPLKGVPEKLQMEIINRVRSILNGRMLSKHESFELGSISILNHFADGNMTTSHTIQGVASIIKLKTYPPDILLKDSTGKVIRDTKAERIAEEQLFMGLIADSADKHPLLNKLIESYKSAVSDPADELVHLFEIIDALKRHYDNKEEAIKQLKLPEHKWDRLHKLSNDEPLKEGRHRGSKKTLRYATDDEISEARKIAYEMIKAFVSTL